MNSTNLITIRQFFANQEIFITGGSGFIGKALIEKILRSCPDVKKIYVLIRSKRSKTVEQRLNDIKENSVFNRLKQESPKSLDKLMAIDGDIMEIGLGITNENLLLLRDVSIIFHVAASVRFDDFLKDAILMNVRGTREMLLIAEKLNNLILFVHISTTYCNPNQSIVKEELYPAPASWEDTIQVAELFDTETLNVFMPKFTNFHPNTYTFTKALAEHTVNDFKERVPVLILRPSIVISSIDEPIPGWLDNFNGPVGLLVACGIGINRTVYGNPDTVMDFTPCDTVVKGILVCTWKHGLISEDTKNNNVQIQENTKKSVEVYNCATANVRCITMREVIDLGRSLMSEVPLNKLLWAPGGNITYNRPLHFIKFILFHILPAFLIDFVLKINGRKQFLVQLQRKIYTANMALGYFIINNWEFANQKFYSLNNDLKYEDYIDFQFKDIKHRDLKMYFKTCIIGARRYLLNEADKDIPKARINYNRMFYLDKFVKYLLLSLIIYVISLGFGLKLSFSGKGV